MDKVRVTAQVLNGVTGEVREVIANVTASNEQDAVNWYDSAPGHNDRCTYVKVQLT